jgi:hypothetical protein
LPEAVLERNRLFSRSLSNVPGAVSVMARTTSEFEHHLPSLYLDIALDGRVLYDPTGYAEDRLVSLQRVIEDAGLYRQRTEVGDIWRWRQEPVGRWTLDWPR